jgi:hypothetical protein
MIYPPTKGLLVSMAMRYSHDYRMPKQVIAPGISSGFSDEGREALIFEVHDIYLKLTAPGATPKGVTESQLFEEIDGTGFYSPGREDYYAASWPEGYVPSTFVPAEVAAPEQKPEAE